VSAARAANRSRTAAPAVPRTPLMRQYVEAKAAHPDAFLFFRLGDFYEMFFDDAVRAAQLLGLTLTSRNKQDPQPVPMCGVPWHQRDTYVGRLLRLGHKVAICEQLEDPAAAKGLVSRGVTEVVTPGSIVADAFLDAAANNFLGALWPAADRLGVCLADASTGEVKLAEPAWDDAASLLARMRVAEWVTPEGVTPDLAARLEAALRGVPGARSPVPAARFADTALPRARWDAVAMQRVTGLDLALHAAAAALDYLDRMQGGAALQLTRVERWGEEETLRYDEATARNLELFAPQPGGEPSHTLWHHLNLCATGPGARRLRGWVARPLAAREALERRLDAVASWVNAAPARGGFRETLRAYPDLERLAARVACGRATPRDLGALRDALARLPEIRAALSGRDGDPGADPALQGAPELEALLRRALVDEPPPLSKDGGVIRAGYDADRDALDDLAHSGKRWIAELEREERRRTGIPSLKVGYNRVFGYYLEVTHAHKDKVPDDYERRQTLTNAERFVTPGLKAKEGEVLSAEERLKAREHELFTALRERAAEDVATLQGTADVLARLDAEAALAEVAARYRWVRPEIDDSDRLAIDGARHPVVERLLPDGSFVPNDIVLDGASRQILLLTGPNMGGKSTYLRQVALAVLLAQAGSFVPAARARIGLVDRLFTRVGAADRLGAGQSTFMVEMSETADILRSATPRSLVLLDEVGRGTATYDGLALAWAVTEHLHAPGGPRPRTLFATHYHELTQLAGQLARLANVHVTVREARGEVVFMHRIAEGAADRSYGIHVAERAGLPAAVITRAREVLAELERERTVDHLIPMAGGGGVEAGAGHSDAGDLRSGSAGGGSESSRPRATDAPRDQAQLGLFGAPGPHPVQEALQALDIEALTPLEALNKLAEWKRRWGG